MSHCRRTNASRHFPAFEIASTTSTADNGHPRPQDDKTEAHNFLCFFTAINRLFRSRVVRRSARASNCPAANYSRAALREDSRRYRKNVRYYIVKKNGDRIERRRWRFTVRWLFMRPSLPSWLLCVRVDRAELFRTNGTRRLLWWHCVMVIAMGVWDDEVDGSGWRWNVWVEGSNERAKKVVCFGIGLMWLINYWQDMCLRWCGGWFGWCRGIFGLRVKERMKG